MYQIILWLTVTIFFGRAFSQGTLGQCEKSACYGCVGTCAAFPPCTSLSFPCYQGSPKDTANTWRTDVALPYGSTWMCGNCSSFGFTKYLRNDPVYTKMELWEYEAVNNVTIPCNTDPNNNGQGAPDSSSTILDDDDDDTSSMSNTG